MRCELCDYESTRKYNFERHLKKCQGKQDSSKNYLPQVCDLCGQPVSSKLALERHKESKACAKRVQRLNEGKAPASFKNSEFKHFDFNQKFSQCFSCFFSDVRQLHVKKLFLCKNTKLEAKILFR